MVNNETQIEKKFLSTKEVADLLGISRVSVFKKIKKGQIKAEKIGRNYVISAKDMNLFSRVLDKKSKKQLSSSVDKVIKDYGETIKLLGNE